VTLQQGSECEPGGAPGALSVFVCARPSDAGLVCLSLFWTGPDAP
jgi:hypothetical protein